MYAKKLQESRDRTVVRGRISHQCGPGSNPGVRWIEFADGSLPFFENFSLGSPVFPHKTPALLNFNST